VVEAYRPENIAARLIAQNTPAVWAFVKLTPLAASRSMFGVMARGVVSRHPIQSFISSTARNRTLGFSPASTRKGHSATKKYRTNRRLVMTCILSLELLIGDDIEPIVRKLSHPAFDDAPYQTGNRWTGGSKFGLPGFWIE
jgi:hypothetical protein